MPDVLQRPWIRVYPQVGFSSAIRPTKRRISASTLRRGERRAEVFTGHELSVPSPQRLGRHDRGDLPQDPPSSLKRPHGKPPSVVIGEAQPLPTHLRAQDTILFHQICRARPVLGDPTSRSGPRTISGPPPGRSRVRVSITNENWPVARSRSRNGTIRARHLGNGQEIDHACARRSPLDLKLTLTCSRSMCQKASLNSVPLLLLRAGRESDRPLNPARTPSFTCTNTLSYKGGPPRTVAITAVRVCTMGSCRSDPTL
jgi:hypothetical protein